MLQTGLLLGLIAQIASIYFGNVNSEIPPSKLKSLISVGSGGMYAINHLRVRGQFCWQRFGFPARVLFS